MKKQGYLNVVVAAGLVSATLSARAEASYLVANAINTTAFQAFRKCIRHGAHTAGELS